MMLEQTQTQEAVLMPQPVVNTATPVFNPAPAMPPNSTPPAPTIEDKPNEIEFDEGLKEKILTTILSMSHVWK